MPFSCLGTPIVTPLMVGMKVLTLPPASSLGGARKPSVSGRLTRDSFGVAKSNAEVRSPTTARRQGEMLGSCTPKRFSMKRITDVWSKSCELTNPPLLQGEMAMKGTRIPNPIGPFGAVVVTSSFSMLTVEAPLALLCGGVGGHMGS